MSPDTKYGIKHGAGFIASGALAFTTDAAVLTALTRGAGLDPFSARLIAIACAMVVAFFAHRHLTFAAKQPATFVEFVKFLSVAFTASLINFAVYAGALLLAPATEPVVALIAATAVAMGVTYVGLRFGVFRKPPA